MIITHNTHTMKKLFVTIVATVLFSGFAMAGEKAQPQLMGRVLETVDGKDCPVPFAYVYCEGTTFSTYTNEKGEFVLSVEKPGKYTLRFSHAAYAVVEKEVKVKKNATKEDYNINKQEVLLTAL